jgi:hypothetical protein
MQLDVQAHKVQNISVFLTPPPAPTSFQSAAMSVLKVVFKGFMSSKGSYLNFGLLFSSLLRSSLDNKDS